MASSTVNLTVQHIPKHDIVKLSESTYLLWKHQVMLIIDGYGLLKYVSNDASTPKVLPHLTGLKSMLTIWSAISRLFGARSSAKVSALRHNLHSQRKAGLTLDINFLCDSASANVVTHAGDKDCQDSRSNITGLITSILGRLTLLCRSFGSVPYYQGGHLFTPQVSYPMSMLPMGVVSSDSSLGSNIGKNPFGPSMTSSPTVFVSTVPSGNVSTNIADTVWYPDTGATHHVTNDLSVFNSGATYTDVWGPTPIISTDGFAYYVSLIDVYSRHTWIYLLKRKYEIDGGGEYQALKGWFLANGVQQRVSCPSTFEQNRKVEKKHRHIVEMCLALLVEPALPLKFWNHAFVSAVHLINQLPTEVLNGKSPFEGKTVDRSHGGTGSSVNVLPIIQPTQGSSQITREAPNSTCDYRKNPGTHLSDVSHAAVAVEDNVCAGNGLITPAEETDLGENESHASTNFNGNTVKYELGLCEESQPAEEQCNKEQGNVHPMVTRSKSGIRKPKIFQVVCSDKEPRTIREVMKSSEWKVAAQAEYNALVKNNTCTLVSLPSGKKPPGIDYHEVFSPVVKPATARIVLSLVLSKRWSLKQVDINNAFLNKVLAEEVYMMQPPGYEQGDGSLVCKLNKAIYGLKQASRAWFERLKEYLEDQRFVLSRSDASLFVKEITGNIVYLLVYVDDIIVTGSCEKEVQGDEIILSQQKYIRDLLCKSSLEDAKGLPTPMATSCKLIVDTGTPIKDATHYWSVVGVLQYVVITRPDITFVVNRVCQFMQSPYDVHLQAVKHILRYLQATVDFGLSFSASSHLSLTRFADINWGLDADDRQVEYRSVARVTAEMAWLESLLSELCVTVHGKFVLWEMVAAGKRFVQEVPAFEQVADVLTKPLSAPISDYIHHVLVYGLKFDTKYYYKTGNGKSAREFWFQTPPMIGPDIPYKFGIIMGHRAQSVLFLGDLSYADRYQYNDVGIRWDSWGRFVERSTAYQPWICSAGNREIEYMPYMLFRLNRNFFDILHLISLLKAAVLCVKYTPQYQWLKDELKRVDREKTPWLIVLMHVPIYNSNEAHFMEGKSMRAVFEEWFIHQKVYVIFSSHVRAYERSHRISNIRYNISSGECYPIRDESAPVYITVGDVGHQ
ncbi:Purple acid phosphatase 26 isoform 2 [Hibiscus syriacus]|uniref:Purple acid phosphatase n=1 Tax=Hibiscus syriacus TaxID=106335 RepID=A0A6A2Y528_HIBSY|nr:Purple acid phosphatase 26 isoform 2 [Hibiscus syriacus]